MARASFSKEKKSRACLILTILGGVLSLGLLLFVLLFLAHDPSVYAWELRHVQIPLSSGSFLAASLAMPLSLQPASDFLWLWSSFHTGRTTCSIHGDSPCGRTLQGKRIFFFFFFFLPFPFFSLFFRNGVVFVALDCPGTGSSPGQTIHKEYSDEEVSSIMSLPSAFHFLVTLQQLQNAQEAISWLSNQSWSTGKIGLVGKSWSAFNALMLAAMQTPHLAAIYVAHGSADLYFNDVHYLDGAKHFDEYM
jgi:hypothetical protein